MSGTDDVDRASALAAADDEIARLRRLVGPHEHSYDDLRSEVAAAQQAVRDAEAANGQLRAEITELRIELRRARQDQYHLWKLVARPQRLLRALRQSAE
ncbi:MAG: hypothetical protein KDB37_01190 [Ilumatobacter sp.]|nr:hypothetical protein [Ilumatobacter sp.]